VTLTRVIRAAALAVIVGHLMLPSIHGRMSESDPQRASLSSDLRVAVLWGREIELEVLTGAGDDYLAIAKRVADTIDVAPTIAELNGGARAREGVWVRVPLSLLSRSYRALLLRDLFPADRRDGEDWIHIARSGRLPVYDEGLWQVAEWFTGDGTHFEQLMEVNRLSSPELRNGQELRIPGALLHAAFKPRLASDDSLLEFDSDARGPYAGYRLRQGEALYSSVVARFTGRNASEDVQEVSESIRVRSGIRDLRDIPVGYEIKIPLDLLEPQFLPSGHPRRLEAEAALEELARELERKPVTGTRGGLEGVVLVLDPGHGGRDLGTMNNGIWEHDYVYDVACRLKQRLERETAARVVLTLEDQETGCAPSRGNKLTANHQGTIATHPPFLAREKGEAQIAVNLRWYLSNSIYRQAQKDGIDPDRVVFMSLHADARHASLRGVMVYVPGAGYRAGTYVNASSRYRKYREVREKPKNSFSKKQRVRSEAVSRKLAESIIRSFGSEGLPVHSHQPIRNRIIRGKKRYVPAVLRGNAVPNKVLVEMINMSNKEDAAVLASAKDRDRLALSLVEALFDYFGEGPRVAQR
jgi:N-acetylmuramoyl-L-alanine amidase